MSHHEMEGEVRLVAESLRERKKRRLRTAISDVATRLFSERGFEAVTVAEIARTADVAENTVYNYFPTKEDLVFDRQADVEADFSRVVRERASGESVAAALRRDFLDALERGDPRIGLNAGLSRFWQLIDSSPSLQARLLAIGQRSVQHLARTLAAEAGAEPDDANYAVLARLVAAVPWALQVEIRRGLGAGQSVDAIREALRPVAERGFDLLDAALVDRASS